MKRVIPLIASAAILALLTTSVGAAPDGQGKGQGKPKVTDPPASTPSDGPVAVVPEIDAAAGGSAIAFLAGILLLFSERRRSEKKSAAHQDNPIA